MKFQAVVVTKKKLIVTLICAVISVSAGAAAFLWDLPMPDNASVTDIVRSGTGIDTSGRKDFWDILKSIVGFDITSSADIVKNGIGLGDASAPSADKLADIDIYEEAESGADGGTYAGEAATEGSETADGNADSGLPSAEEINSGRDLSINNATAYDADLEELCAEGLNIHIDGDEPQVLVMHTHTTECYDGDEMPGETERTTDETKSVVRIGDIICQTLEGYGIKTVHDATVHDYPTYQGSYTRALSTITDNIERYPSIKIVFDVHRDAFVYDDGTKLRVTDENADRPTAQAMIVSGTDSMGLYDPEWRENLKFAAKIQSAANIMYPGLMRAVNLRTERFNMHVTTGSLLFEIGSNGNTLEEAENAAEDLANAVAAVLLSGC